MFMYLSRGTRMCAALLAGLLLALAASPAQAGAAWRHWSYDAVKKCVSYGIMDSEDIDPDEEITRGEFCSWVNRAFNLTVATGGRVFQRGTHYPDPYATDMLIASATGYLVDSGGTKGPNDGISREQAFTSLAAVYMLEGDAKAKTAYKDDADISSWARGPVNAMLNAGFISIGDKLEPQAPLTKGQAAQTLANMYGEIRDGDNTSETYKNLTVRVPGVTVKNATVTGDLFVTSGVGTGDATFEDVTVYGRALIAGGGPNSVYFRKSTLITVNINSGSKTRVKLENTDLNTLIFTTSGTFVYNGRVIAFDADTLKLMFTGTFDSITKNADGSVTVVIDGKSFTIQFELPGGVSLDNISVLTPPSFGMVYSPTASAGRNRTAPSNPSPTPGPGQTGFTITYNANGGQNPPVDKNTYAFGAKATVMEELIMTPTAMEGFDPPEFVGWNTSPNYIGDFYNPYDPERDTIFIDGDITLYAVWSGTGNEGDYEYVVYDAASLKGIEGDLENGNYPMFVIFAADFALTLDDFVSELALPANVNDGQDINGNTHTIRCGGTPFGPFFENLGTIYDLAVTGNIVSDFSIVDGIVVAGGIAVANWGTISRCVVLADITVNNSYGYSAAGGVAGFNQGTIEDCYTTGDINAYSASHTAYAGGINGFNRGLIWTCYAMGDITANYFAGGIAGYNDYSLGLYSFDIEMLSLDVPIEPEDEDESEAGSETEVYMAPLSATAPPENTGIRRCVALNKNVTGTLGIVGRVVGYNAGTLLGNLGLRRMLVNGIPRDISDPRHKQGLNLFIPSTTKQNLYDNNLYWDFEYIWRINEGESYPFLQWQPADAAPAPHVYEEIRTLSELMVEPYELEVDDTVEEGTGVQPPGSTDGENAGGVNTTDGETPTGDGAEPVEPEA